MQSYLKTTMFTGQDNFIKRYGFEIWESLCNSFEVGKWFTVREAAIKCQGCIPLNLDTRYVRLVINNVMAEHKVKNTGEVPIEKLGNFYRFI